MAKLKTDGYVRNALGLPPEGKALFYAIRNDTKETENFLELYKVDIKAKIPEQDIVKLNISNGATKGIVPGVSAVINGKTFFFRF